VPTSSDSRLSPEVQPYPLTHRSRAPKLNIDDAIAAAELSLAEKEEATARADEHNAFALALPPFVDVITRQYGASLNVLDIDHDHSQILLSKAVGSGY
jgi:hypothetical protein